MEELAGYDAVVFVDAAIGGPACELREVGGEAVHSPFTHHVSLAELCLWTEAIYGKRPRCFSLSIRGYDFDFGEGLSPQAQENLAQAEERLRDFLRELKRDEIHAH